MGLLADIYSAGDGLKRKVGGLLSDPMGTIDLAVSRIKEDNNNALNLFSNAFPMAGENTVLNSPEQIAQLQKQAAEYASQVGMAAATVWHGSPHKFDKFDSSKIGTGEGAQAYGHGLYLAESDDVARSYQQSTQRPEFLVNGEKWAMDQGGVVRSPQGKTTATLPLDQYNAIFGLTGSKANKPLSELAEEAESFLQTRSGMTPAKIAAAKKAILDGKIKLNAETGSLYKVDLPDDQIAKMLDWDKPLSQQSKEVQKAIAKTKTMLPPNAMDDLGGDLSLMYGPDVRPQDFLNTWESFGSKAGGENALKKLGVPGIRYLDGGSRGAGQGSSNFVVFPGNEGLLQILERNGQPIGGR